MLCVFFLPLSEMIKLCQEKKKSKLYRKGHLYEVRWLKGLGIGVFLTPLPNPSILQILSLFLQMCIGENLREYEKARVTAVGGGGVSFPLVFGKEKGDGPGT